MGLIDLIRRKLSGDNGNADIRIQLPASEGSPPDAVFIGEKKISVRLAPAPGEEHLQQFAGDMTKTQLVGELLEVSPEQRDEKWCKAFLDNVADVNFYCEEPLQPVDGPDGFPYLCLTSPEPGKPYRAWVIRHILPNLLDHGFGVVINPQKGQPDWVFSYGDIVNYHIHGAFDAIDERFESYDSDTPAQEDMDAGEKINVGEASEQILPQPLRTMLRRFLKAYHLSSKVFLMDRVPSPEAGRKGGLSLVFPLPPDASENDEKLGYVTRALPWFLPRHYSIAWMREGSDLHFYDL